MAEVSVTSWQIVFVIQILLIPNGSASQCRFWAGWNWIEFLLDWIPGLIGLNWIQLVISVQFNISYKDESFSKEPHAGNTAKATRLPRDVSFVTAIYCALRSRLVFAQSKFRNFFQIADFLATKLKNSPGKRFVCPTRGGLQTWLQCRLPSGSVGCRLARYRSGVLWCHCVSVSLCLAWLASAFS